MDLEIEKLSSKDPKVKYGFAKELLHLAANAPSKLYDYFDDWGNMLKSPNNILKWTAIDIIGYLSSVDTENKIGSKIDELIGLMNEGRLITTNHAVFALGLIAKNKQDHRDRILKEFLVVPRNNYDSADCRDIATGKVIDTLMNFIPQIWDDRQMRILITEACNCNRNGTKKKGEMLLRKIEKYAASCNK